MLVDLTPEALIERLRAGKVYPPERVAAALNGFFRIENLEALREVALRQVAEDVEAKRLVRERAAAARGPAAAQARRRRSASGCSRWSRRSRPRSASCAARGARRSGWAPSSTCSIVPGRASRRDAEREQLEALRRLASLLGAHLLVEEGDDVAEVAARVARERGTTYVLIGHAGAARPGCAASPSRSRPARCGALPGRRRADRRRPLEAASASMSADRCSPRAAGRRRGLALARAPTPPATHEPVGAARILFPFVGSHAVERGARRGAAARARRGRHARAGLPRAGADDAAARRAAAARVRRGVRAARGDRAARRDARRPGRRRGSAAAAPSATRCASCWPTSATTASSSRPRRPTRTGFSADDVAWLLEHAPGEVAILRPADEAALAAA